MHLFFSHLFLADQLIASNWILISENALSEDTRKRAEYATHGQAASNAALLPKWLELQTQIVTLLGYRSVSHFHTEVLMAQSPEQGARVSLGCVCVFCFLTCLPVTHFLDDMSKHCFEAARADLATMLAMQAEDCKARSQPFDGKPHLWNWRFYRRMAKEKARGLLRVGPG